MTNLIDIIHENQNVSCNDCAVKGCSILQHCSKECLDIISSSKKVIGFKKGQRIVLEGNVSQQIYFVKSGIIKIYKTDKNGHELILRLAKTGDIIGYGAPNENNEYEESAMAIDNTILCYLDHDVFDQLVYFFPQLALELLKFYKNELRISEYKLIKLVHLNVPRKVADALITMFDAYGVSGGKNTLNLSFSRQAIADLAGTTKEQVSKILAEFKTEGIIEIRKKEIDILNLNKLRELCKV